MDPINVTTLVEILGSAGVAIVAVVAFLDRRTASVRAEFESEIGNLKARIEKLESRGEEARRHIFQALLDSQLLQGAEKVIESLKNALQSL